MTPDERIVGALGIHNFRDYGGYPALGGTRLKAALLFRSAQHKEAADADLATVIARRIETIVDLRGNAERTLHPCRRHPRFAGRVHFVEGDTVNPATENAAFDSAEGARKRMRRSYADMPFRPLMQRAMACFFAALAEAENATLVHCLAGKDRTGLAVALFHYLLGVHPDDAMEDYMLTNEAGRIEERIESGAAIIRSNFGSDIPVAAIRTLMSADPSFLQASLNAINERYGSVDRYAETALGVTAQRRVDLAERYLA